jgi:CrcB protein
MGFNVLLVAIGGALGSVLRYLTSLFVSHYFSGKFPLATFIINFLGCFLIGVFLHFSLRADEKLKYLFVIGFCGGFTTFSTFANENLQLFQSGNYFLALVYMLLSVILGVVAVWLGMVLLKL